MPRSPTADHLGRWGWVRLEDEEIVVMTVNICRTYYTVIKLAMSL